MKILISFLGSNVFGNKVEQVLTCVVNGDKYDENWAIKKAENLINMI